MENKDDKKDRYLTKDDIVTSILTALAVGVAGLLMIIIAVIVVIIISPRTVQDAPAAQSYIPSSAPAQSQSPSYIPSITPAQSPSPEPSASVEPDATEPAETPSETVSEPPEEQSSDSPESESSDTPESESSSPDPSASSSPSVTPSQPAQNPETSAPAETTQNSDGTYTHDFSGGRVLITTAPDNNGDPVYHTEDCRAAEIISPDDEYWYDSAQTAEADGRRLCEYCAE